MAAKHLGNRTERRKRKRKTYWLIIFNLLLITLVACGSVLLWNKVQNGHFFSQHQTMNSSSETMESSSKAPTTQKDSNKENTTNIQWVKQEEAVKIPILMYHAIHVMDPSEAANAGLIVAPDVFESHLKVLKEAGYYSLTPEEAYKILTENVLPDGNKKVVWLTFDDSNADFYSQAFPLLEKYKMKATNNVITGFVENGYPSQLTLEQIKEMKAKGMSFEGHTVNHPDLSASSIDSQNSELSISKNYLDNTLNQTTTTVAYPSGRYLDGTLQTAENLGYKLGLTTNPGLASASNGLLSLNRVRIQPTTTDRDLLAEIAIN